MLVTGHEQIRPGRAREREQVVVGGILRQRLGVAGIGDPDRPRSEQGHKSRRLSNREMTPELRAQQHILELSENLGRNEQIERSVEPLAKERSRSADSRDQRRDEDTRVEDDPEHLATAASALGPHRMQFVVGKLHRLVLGEVRSLPDAFKQPDAEVLAESFLYDVGVAFAGPRGANSRGPKHIGVEVDGCLGAGHALTITL